MTDFLTFQNLIDEVERGVKVSGGSKLELIKAVINQVYLNEILTADTLYPPFWLVTFDDTLNSVAPATITAITKANPGVLTTGTHGLAIGDIVYIHSIVGMVELNNRFFKVDTVPSSTTLTLIDLDGTTPVDTTDFTIYESAGTIQHRGKTLTTTGKDVQKILKAKWSGQGADMSPFTWEDVESDSTLISTTAGVPSKFIHRKTYSTAGVEENSMVWFPGADAAYDLRYWMQIRAPRLVTAASDVPLLPPQFHQTIVAGAITRLAESPILVEAGLGVWATMYKQQIQNLINFNRDYYLRSQKGTPYLL